jgi:branched-chain amino acid transport system ATP-binding protein
MTALLRADGLETAYGASQVLFGVSLDIGEGEVVSLLGRNGMGKTTTVRSIMGLIPSRGRIWLAGERIDGRSAPGIARAGVGLVPEGRQVFPNLTVRENLEFAPRPPLGNGAPAWTLPRVLELFPPLAERLAAMGRTLSGGEQQMLAIGRALMTNPRLLVLDEATEGLAPLVRRDIWRCLAALKAAGQAVLLIDKNIAALTRIADRHYILEKGRVVWQGTSPALRDDHEAQHRFLGIGAQQESRD